MRPLSAKIESACPHFEVGTLMRPLSSNIESACPHFDTERPITTYCTDYSHAMHARRGSEDDLFEESSSRCPPQSMLEALIAVGNIDRPFFAVASEGSRADGNADNNLRKHRGGFNGYSLYKRHVKHCITAGNLSLMDYVHHIGSSGSAPMAGVARNKTNVHVSMCNYDTENVEGLKFTNIRFKQEWHNLSDEDRDQYNCFARDLRNNRQEMVGCQGEKNNAQKFRHKIDELL